MPNLPERAGVTIMRTEQNWWLSKSCRVPKITFELRKLRIKFARIVLNCEKHRIDFLANFHIR